MNATHIRLTAFGGGGGPWVKSSVMHLQIIFSICVNVQRSTSTQTIRILHQMFFCNCVNFLASIYSPYKPELRNTLIIYE